jgi:uncharacterized protein (DUF697 family)/GTP-binding protein EngB required for normal cell division
MSVEAAGPVDGQEPFSAEAFGAAYADAGRAIGRVNIGVFGKTGVGKSTLVNAIFGEEVARTGVGEPITKGSHLYLHKFGHMGIIDNQGLEIGQDSAAILTDLQDFISRQRNNDLSEQLHVAWYCIHAGHRRVETLELEFVRELMSLGVPVILVITQVPRRAGIVDPKTLELREYVRRQFNSTPILTAAIDDEFAGLTKFGLQDLLDATFRDAPEGVAEALAAAQRIDLKRKDATVKKVVAVAMASAAGVAVSPIPFSDAALIVPVQLAMMGRIAHIYGLKLEKASAAAMVATGAATTLGRTTVTGLLKFIPGVGTAVGGFIGAGVASALTLAMGTAWQVVCLRIFEGKLDPGILGDRSRIADVFIAELKRRPSKR